MINGRAYKLCSKLDHILGIRTLNLLFVQNLAYVHGKLNSCRR